MRAHTCIACYKDLNIDATSNLLNLRVGYTHLSDTESKFSHVFFLTLSRRRDSAGGCSANRVLVSLAESGATHQRCATEICDPAGTDRLHQYAGREGSIGSGDG